MKSQTAIQKRIKEIVKANKDIVKLCGNDDSLWEQKYIFPKGQILTDYSNLEAKLINNGMLVMLCWVLEIPVPHEPDESYTRKPIDNSKFPKI